MRVFVLACLVATVGDWFFKVELFVQFSAPRWQTASRCEKECLSSLACSELKKRGVSDHTNEESVFDAHAKRPKWQWTASLHFGPDVGASLENDLE